MKNQTFTFILFFSVCFSSNSFAQWESIGSGISATQRTFFSISVVDEHTIWAVPIKNDFTASHEFTKTINGGTIWEEGSLPDTIGNYFPGNIFAISENIAWIIMINLPQQNHIKILKTENGGNSWVEQYGEFNNAGHAFPTLHFFNENEGVGFGSPGTDDSSIDSLQIFKTSDGGDNWYRIPPNTLPAPLAGEGVWVYSGNNFYDVKGDTIWFGTRAGRVFRSIDKGSSWEAFTVGISGTVSYPGLSSIAFENSLNGIAVTFQPSKAFRTVDGGVTWSQITIPSSPKFGAVEYIPGTENTYLINDGAQGTSTKMLLTKNGGNTWETFTYPPSMVCMQFIFPTIGFGGDVINPANGIGLYKWTGNLSDSATTNTTDLDFASDIVNLYPNPVGNNLTVAWKESVFNSTELLIEIISFDGKHINADKYNLAKELNISTNDLPKGFYSLRVTGDKKSVIKKFAKG